MTSAALDAVLCLLLVSAAAVTVTSTSPPESPTPAGDRADAVAETLVATTAEIPYRLRPVPDDSPDSGPQQSDPTNPEFERVAHGTLTSLLADIAVRTVRIDGKILTNTNNGFATAVRERVNETLPPRTRVVVRWQPFPGSHLGRQFGVGPKSPANTAIHAETVHVPSGVPTPSNASVTAQAAGFNGVARAVADSLVDGLFPPAKARLAVAGDAPTDRLVRHRYREASNRYDVSISGRVAAGETEAANRRLAEGMHPRIESDLKESFETSESAAETLSLGTVDISVRTWGA